MQQKEDVYLATIKKYTPEEVSLFCQAFASMVLWMEGHPLSDPFADYYQQYISHGHNGQFFTPEPVARLMSRLVNVRGDGMKVNDCCCGSGGLLLAAAQENRDMEFIGADISEMCCLMTLISLCLYDLKGEVRHMNTLSQQIWRVWQVRRWPITRHPYIQEITIVSE